MSMGRILGAGLAGGVAMFVWGAVHHMATPFGEVGMKSLPGEQMILPALRFSIKEPGFYMFPGIEKEDMKDEAKCKEWEARVKAGPQGVVIFNPQGGDVMSPAQLGREFGSNTLACLVLAMILARIGGGKGTKMAYGLLAGLFASLSIDVSLWNWYGFPGEMAVGSFVEQIVGGALSGLVIGLVLGRAKPSPAM